MPPSNCLIRTPPRRMWCASAWSMRVTNNLPSLLVTCQTRVALVTISPGYQPFSIKCECQQLSMGSVPFEWEDFVAVSFITETINWLCCYRVLFVRPYQVCIPTEGPFCLYADVWVKTRAVSCSPDTIFLEKWMKVNKASQDLVSPKMAKFTQYLLLL